MNDLFKYLLCFILLPSCSFSLTPWKKQPPLPSYFNDIHVENSCLPKAIVVKKHLNKKDVWSEVILYYYNERKTSGHAITAFEFNNMIWTYDYMGSYSVRGDKTNPLIIAKNSETRRGSNKKVYSAKFLN